jgi:hypothetical protein
VGVSKATLYKYLWYTSTYSHHLEEECILPPITLQLHNVITHVSGGVVAYCK